ncbi:sulfatase-like hydrolase/transferase [Haloarchaeobius sp. TZWSO28]|uniref:sulfatase-like hydrolase/transferase n=1 Tax=Haloarchaeobius sp. TZWSO28 TaxID=3446119 RepID=UPI003EB8D6DA
MTGPPSIAVVVLDTLRYDMFAEEFDWLEGMWFENAYSTSHWTVPAHGSLFTGLYPSENGVHSQSQTLDCEQPTIAERLQDEGYRTTKYTANLNIHTWDDWDRGFMENIGPNELQSYYETETVDFTRHMSTSNKSGLPLYLDLFKECIYSDCSTVYSLLDGVRRYIESSRDGGARSVLRRLEGRSVSEHEFLFVNIMDAHVPYFPPEPYRRINHEVTANNWEPFVDGISNLSEVTTAYEDAVDFLADKYQEIYQKLDSQFDYVITLSDHGEMLGEYGMIEHAYGVFPQLPHVPLVISGDNIPNRSVKTPVSLLDVHATIGDLAGISLNSRGQSLLDDPTPKDRLVEYHGFLPWLRETFLEQGVSEQRYGELNEPLRGILTTDGVYAFETHEQGFLTTADNNEIDLSTKQERLKNLVENLNVRDVNQDTASPDDAVLDQLEDLGYA